jgi:hypothetical protein
MAMAAVNGTGMHASLTANVLNIGSNVYRQTTKQRCVFYQTPITLFEGHRV